ncbi:hypothetical protein KOW79_008488 [Hemibagrus wyckioides]|uniref:Immunoglobulin V-set domain-containing protein n=1 Tax=Hemibagrus wyckioides TaxID=337641 RepID=A0A9D3NUK7_9TELE|nr:hypothetical protein KOW79_008488 [Hemibagrus wyckioides]
MIRALVIFQSLYWIQGILGANDVSQSSTLWVTVGQSATINCSHNKGSAYSRMYWFRQLHGESMELIVYSPTYGTPDFGNFSESKFSVSKTVPQSGSFTVNDVDYNDRVQNPPDLVKNQDEIAEIKCAHTVKNYDRILCLSSVFSLIIKSHHDQSSSHFSVTLLDSRTCRGE